MFDLLRRLLPPAWMFVFALTVALAGCEMSSDDEDDGKGGGVTEVSDTHPYLTAQPTLTSDTPGEAAADDPVTVSLDATGPNGIFSITAELKTPSNEVSNGAAALVQVGDTEQWSGTVTVSNPATVSTSYLHITLQVTEITEENNDPIITEYNNGEDTEATKYTFVQRTLNALESSGEGESEHDLTTIEIVLLP